MKRRKRKPKPIPNAGIVERAMADAKWMRALTEAHEATARALERGRTVGRLEQIIAGLAAWRNSGFKDHDSAFLPTTRDIVLPILRAEVERLRKERA